VRSTAHVFVAHAPEDAPLRKELGDHLAGLVRDGTLHVWSRADIGAGDDKQTVVAQHIDDASLILLLVSPALIASDACMRFDVDRSMARAAKGEARVVPILVRACDIGGAPFEHLEMRPAKGRPIAPRADHDAAWLEIVQEIRDLVAALPARPVARATPHNLLPSRTGTRAGRITASTTTAW
jgi:hypothetical protein